MMSETREHWDNFFRQARIQERLSIPEPTPSFQVGDQVSFLDHEYRRWFGTISFSIIDPTADSPMAKVQLNGTNSIVEVPISSLRESKFDGTVALDKEV